MRMKNKKILILIGIGIGIGILVVTVIIGIVLISECVEEKPPSNLYINNFSYCESANDCICAEEGCFWGNKYYYERYANKTQECMDMCYWGMRNWREDRRCINNTCTIITPWENEKYNNH